MNVRRNIPPSLEELIQEKNSHSGWKDFDNFINNDGKTVTKRGKENKVTNRSYLMNKEAQIENEFESIGDLHLFKYTNTKSDIFIPKGIFIETTKKPTKIGDSTAMRLMFNEREQKIFRFDFCGFLHVMNKLNNRKRFSTLTLLIKTIIDLDDLDSILYIKAFLIFLIENTDNDYDTALFKVIYKEMLVINTREICWFEIKVKNLADMLRTLVVKGEPTLMLDESILPKVTFLLIKHTDFACLELNKTLEIVLEYQKPICTDSRGVLSFMLMTDERAFSMKFLEFVPPSLFKLELLEDLFREKILNSKNTLIINATNTCRNLMMSFDKTSPYQILHHFARYSHLRVMENLDHYKNLYVFTLFFRYYFDSILTLDDSTLLKILSDLKTLYSNIDGNNFGFIIKIKAILLKFITLLKYKIT